MNNKGYARGGKRVLDVSVSAMALALGWPVLATVAAAVRLQLGSPVLFRQRRPGRAGRAFTILKFRTMTDAHGPDGTLLSDAQRLTPLGRWLRRTSLDELPELLNVLRGDMSLVGPRPLLERYRAHYSQRERLRETVRPGITGQAQVQGRNHLGWDARLEADAQYASSVSLWNDLRILAQTVGAVATASGVEEDTAATMADLDAERAIRLEPLGPDHAPALVALHREAFDDAELETTIFAGHGIATYYADILREGGEHQALGAFVGSTLVGYAHVREAEGHSHLNQIATAPKARGRGIGRRLFEAWLERSAASTFSLDVREGTPADAWYRRRGFALQTRSVLWRVPSAAGPAADNAPLEETPQDLAQYRRYGFSQMRVRSQGATVHGVGKLGPRDLRVSAQLPRDLLVRLRRTAPVRRLLVVGCAEPPLPDAQRLHTVLRLERRAS